jgi:hypothetical protein
LTKVHGNLGDNCNLCRKINGGKMRKLLWVGLGGDMGEILRARYELIFLIFDLGSIIRHSREVREIMVHT